MAFNDQLQEFLSAMNPSYRGVEFTLGPGTQNIATHPFGMINRSLGEKTYTPKSDIELIRIILSKSLPSDGNWFIYGKYVRDTLLEKNQDQIDVCVSHSCVDNLIEILSEQNLITRSIVTDHDAQLYITLENDYILTVISTPSVKAIYTVDNLIYTSSGDLSVYKSSIPLERCLKDMYQSRLVIISPPENDADRILALHREKVLMEHGFVSERKCIDSDSVDLSFLKVKFEDEECPICMDNMNESEIVQLECGHTFHFDCMVKSITSGNLNCALCRSDIVLK